VQRTRTSCPSFHTRYRERGIQQGKTRPTRSPDYVFVRSQPFPAPSRLPHLPRMATIPSAPQVLTAEELQAVATYLCMDYTSHDATLLSATIKLAAASAIQPSSALTPSVVSLSFDPESLFSLIHSSP